MLIDGLNLTASGGFKNSGIEFVSVLPVDDLYDGREVALRVTDGEHQPGPYTYLNGSWIRLVDAAFLASEMAEKLATLTSISGITTWTGLPYDIATAASGMPDADAILCLLTVARPFTLPANFGSSAAKAKVAAAQSCVFSVLKNGEQIGTFVFAQGSTTATFSIQAAVVFSHNDVLSVVAPTTPDAALSDVSFTLACTLN